MLLVYAELNISKTHCSNSALYESFHDQENIKFEEFLTEFGIDATEHAEAEITCTSSLRLLLNLFDKQERVFIHSFINKHPLLNDRQWCQEHRDESCYTEVTRVGSTQDMQAYDTLGINGGMSSKPAQVLSSFSFLSRIHL